MPFIAIVLLIAAALGGGTAVAAGQALPGDPLWGFKVHINEGVQGALSTSDQTKVDWDIASIEARLAEAQKLSASGKLDAQAQAQIAENFSEHAQGAEDAIGKLEANGNTSAAADAAARFQAAVAEFVSISGGAQGTAEVGDNSRPTLNAAVRSVLNTASQLSAQTNTRASAEDSHKSGDTDSVEVHATTSINASEGDDSGAEDGVLHGEADTHL